MKYYQVICLSLLIAGALTVVNDTEECWSLKYDYPCCEKNTTEMVFEDTRGRWGRENDTWCGLPLEDSKSGENKNDTIDDSEEGNEDYKNNPNYSMTILPDGGILETGVILPLPENHTQAPYPEKPNEGTDACSSK